MILKIGYQTKNGVSAWEYHEGFDELRICPFRRNEYFIDEKTCNVFFAPVIGNAGDILEFGDKIDITGAVKTYFHPDIIQKDSILYLTHVSFRDKETGNYNRIVVPADSLYVMNDSGKTVDRY